MIIKGTISLSELLETSSQETRETKFTYKASECARPLACDVDEFRSSDWMLSSSSSHISNGDCSSRYDLNWCNPSDYLDNWNKLSSVEKARFKALVESDTRGNSNRFGLKKLNLESHLLLSIGADIENITGTGKDPILTNLKNKHTKDYHQEIFDNRTVDPRSSLRAYKKFEKTYSVESLFKMGMECYQAVVTIDQEHASLKDPQLTKEVFTRFFQENNRMFSKLCAKKKKILSYLYSHEISVDSIMLQQYRAHTHIVFWVARAEKGKGSSSDVLEIENIFNNSFKDRKMEIERISSDKESVPRVSRKFKDIEGFLGYLFRCYSLAPQYLREIREDNIQALNKKTVETLHNLIWLMKGDVFSKGVKRNNHSYIPRKDKLDSFKHPLLPTEGISNTIKVKIPRNLKGTAHALSSNQPCQPNLSERSRKISSKTKLSKERNQRRVSEGGSLRAGSAQTKLSGKRSSLSKASGKAAESSEQKEQLSSRGRADTRDHKVSRIVQQELSGRKQKRVERNAGRAQKAGSQPELHRRNAERSVCSENLCSSGKPIQKVWKVHERIRRKSSCSSRISNGPGSSPCSTSSPGGS